jgi:hypothetical protein
MSDKPTMKLYRTSDIYFAAYLCSLDFPLEATENDKNPEGQRKVVFVFKMPDEHIKRAKTGYFGGTATVKARKFVDNIRSLKSMCFV